MDKLKRALLDLDEDDGLLDIVEDIKEFKARIEQQIDEFPIAKDGKNGRDGRDGRDGLDGVDGKGFKGEKGEKGEQGEKGESGKDGKDGKSFDKEDLEPEIKKVRSELLSIVSHAGGGGAYRNIAFAGNPSVLSRYNDINFKPGANVTISYANNDNTKMVDVTIASSGGGGGSVIGTTRSINTINTSQTAGSTSLTDYVYICSGGVNLTLPDAVGNTNLYTIKNTSTSSVLVSTTSAETIDTSANLILPIQFTSVDLISDGSNWEIT